MNWQIELRDYMVKVLGMGFSENEIRAALRSVGWREVDIDNGLAVARLKQENKTSEIAPLGSPASTWKLGFQVPKLADKHQDLQQLTVVGDRVSRDLAESALVPMLTADKTPNLLLSSPDEKFPIATKTAIPLLLALLSRRAEALKRASRPARSVRSRIFGAATSGGVLKLLARGPKREPLAIAPAFSTQPLLLAAPSWRVIWLMRLQFITERIFAKIEAAVAIAGRIILLPVAFFGLAVKLSGGILRAVSARYGKTAMEKQRAGLSIGGSAASSSPATMLIGEKFSEHIVLFDIFKLAGRMFRTRRLRTFLTISGISVGIGTILFLVSFGYGLQNILFERITTEEALLTLDVVPPSDNAVVAIDDAMIEKVHGIDGVAEVSKMIALNGEMAFGESSAAGFIYAADATYPRMIGIKAAADEFAASQDHSAVIISSAAAKLLGWGDSPEAALNKEISFVAGLPKAGSGEIETVALEGRFRVAGVADDPFSVFAYFPIERMSGLHLPSYSQLKVKVKDTTFLEPTRDKILTMGLLVSMLTETVDQARKVFNVVKLVLGLFGVITLVVSAIGMLNTLTIALLERTQEVGIMKAVGASNFDIWKLFLAEAVIMGFLGGVGGIAIGYVSAEIFNYGINLLAKTFGGQALNLFQTPTWFVLTIVGFSSCIGIVTGLWPARRASRLDPLDALKYK